MTYLVYFKMRIFSYYKYICSSENLFQNCNHKTIFKLGQHIANGIGTIGPRKLCPRMFNPTWYLTMHYIPAILRPRKFHL
jgi:hypothetical protein